jgi:hypothetical protein
MTFKLEKLTPEQWSTLSPHAHVVSFGKKYEPDFERISFAILAVDECGVPMGFITCLEHTKTQVYWQYGGSFPGTKGTINTYRIYTAAKDLCAKEYQTITTLIENDNLPMLKMALKVGFKIVGVKHIFSKTYVELLIDLKENES